jgi:methionyl-tRNA formyltransferase
MKLVFCGTPEFAVPTLEALIAAGHEIALVVSQPDRPVGRKQGADCAAGQADRACGMAFEVTQPEKIKNNAEFRAQLEAIAPDAIVVVAYGRIIPRGCWICRAGLHQSARSLLPKYRGAAPIQWAVAMGDAVTGNTTMLLEEGLDTGRFCCSSVCRLGRSRRRSIFSKSWRVRARRWWWRRWPAW